MNTNDQNFLVSIWQEQPTTNTVNQIFTVGDAGRVCHRSPSSIRRLAVELNIRPQRTANGTRIFTNDQVQKIAGEITRRERETFRR